MSNLHKLGNVVCICVILVILGIAIKQLYHPCHCTKEIVKREIPVLDWRNKK